MGLPEEKEREEGEKNAQRNTDIKFPNFAKNY